MVRICSLVVAGDGEVVPPAVSTRGRAKIPTTVRTMEARGRASARAREHVRVVSVEDQFVDDQIEVLVPPQHLEGFITAPVFQEAMDKMVSFIDALTQAGVVPVVQAASQDGGGVQTPITRTLE